MEGITPYDFVQRVYYAQEKVILDFHPTDDKYKEVIMEGNIVVREFQDEEDWSFQRDRIILGDLHPIHGQQVPEFKIPEYVTKPSTLHGDGVRLHKVRRDLRPHGYNCHHCGHCDHQPEPSEQEYIYVPYASKGTASYRDHMIYNEYGWPGTPSHHLNAINIGKIITFNRPLNRWEWERRLATCDVQLAVEQFKQDRWDDDEYHYKHVMWEQIPNVDYLVIKTAAYHSAGSPVASGRAMDLTDQHQKMLSTMRDNDAAKTTPDIIYAQPLNYIEV